MSLVQSILKICDEFHLVSRPTGPDVLLMCSIRQYAGNASMRCVLGTRVLELFTPPLKPVSQLYRKNSMSGEIIIFWENRMVEIVVLVEIVTYFSRARSARR